VLLSQHEFSLITVQTHSKHTAGGSIIWPTTTTTTITTTTTNYLKVGLVFLLFPSPVINLFDMRQQELVLILGNVGYLITTAVLYRFMTKRPVRLVVVVVVVGSSSS